MSLFSDLKDVFTAYAEKINDLGERVDALESGGSGSGSGLTDGVKTALMNLVNHVAWDDDDPTGQTYITALYDALYPTVTTRTVSYSLSHVASSNNASTVTSGASYTATLTASSGYTINTVTITMGGADVTSTVYSSGTITIPSVTGNIVITATAVASVSSISAVYTQSGTVYTNTNLNSLKSDLVVTATYTGGTTSTIPGTDYTLSGTLTVGTSTITVTYGGKTTTFNVTVSQETVSVRNIVDYATVVREHAYGVNNNSVNDSWPEVVYSIPNVKSGDVLVLPNGSNEATWATYRNIGKVDQSSSAPQITLGEWVKVGSQYGYYPITVNEDLDILYIRFKPAYSSAATWTRESGF